MLKALELVGAILLAGGPVFQALTWRPALTAAPVGRREALDLAVMRRVQTGATVGFLLVAATSFLSLVDLAATLAGSSALSAATASRLAAVLLQTSLGPLVVLRVLLAAGVWTAVRTESRRTGGGSPVATGVPHLAAIAAGIGMLATFTLAGHAVTAGGAKVLTISFDLAHLVAAATWGGGLAYFALIPWRELAGEEGVPVIHRAVRRFSVQGLAAVAVLAGTGLFISLQRLYGLMAIVETRYGLALLWKLGFLAGVLILAGKNLFVIRARLRRAVMEGTAADAAVNSLRQRVGVEAAGVLIIVMAAGYMSTQPPPDRTPVPRGPITITNLRYTPDTIEMPRGKPVRLTVVNGDPVTHSLAVERLPFEGLRGHVHDPAAGSRNELVIYIPPRSRKANVFTALRSGTYRVYCALEDHADRGMTGTLVVK